MKKVICSFTPGSDVCILQFIDEPGLFNFHCSGCIMNDGATICYSSSISMLLHLKMHKKKGHKVPGFAKRMLWDAVEPGVKTKYSPLKPADSH